MERQPASVSADGLESWNDAVRRAETIEVLSDHDAVRALADTEPVVHGRDAVRQLIADRVC